MSRRGCLRAITEQVYLVTLTAITEGMKKISWASDFLANAVMCLSADRGAPLDLGARQREFLDTLLLQL